MPVSRTTLITIIVTALVTATLIVGAYTATWVYTRLQMAEAAYNVLGYYQQARVLPPLPQMPPQTPADADVGAEEATDDIPEG